MGNKLPDRGTQRTQLVVVVHMPIHIKFDSHRRLAIVEGDAPYKISTNGRITKLILKQFGPLRVKPNVIKTALEYDKVYKSLTSPTLAKVAEHFGVTRVRVWQMLNLLKLDQRIIDYLSNISDPKENNFWTERRLRKIFRLPMSDQYREFDIQMKSLHL